MDKIKNSLVIIALVVVITFISYQSNLPAEDANTSTTKVSIKKLDTTRQIASEKTLPSKIINPALSFETSPQLVNQESTSSQNQQQSAVTKPQIYSYSASVSYQVPESTQELTLQVSLKNNIIVDVSTSLSKKGGTSRRYQENFENSYKSQVIGKNIKNLILSRVGGASITTDAFNEAITSIKNSL